MKGAAFKLFSVEKIQSGDLVLIVYERPEVKFETIAKYGEGGIKGSRDSALRTVVAISRRYNSKMGKDSIQAIT